jgi:hypothetical protein
MMNDNDYPALFCATDMASNKTQKIFISLNATYLIFTILGTFFAFFDNSKLFAVFSASLFLLGLFLLIVILSKKYDQKWYSCRAIAESIKTATWRFMMKSEPYDDSKTIIQTKAEFRNLLRELLKNNTSITDLIGGQVSEQEQITSKMLEVRNIGLTERITFYLKNRIDEQRKWYAKKYKSNKKSNLLWFLFLILFNSSAGVLAIIKISDPTLDKLPIDIFAVIAVSSLTWIQLKKYQDLTSSYAITAHEIGSIRGIYEEVKTEEDFSNFVIDTENAFSREHTQWIAKRSS